MRHSVLNNVLIKGLIKQKLFYLLINYADNIIFSDQILFYFEI